MTMVERVARALCAANSHDPDAHFQDATLWRLFIPLARAAIEAMEPTEAMVEAFSNHWNLHCGEGAPPSLMRDALAAALHVAALEGEG